MFIFWFKLIILFVLFVQKLILCMVVFQITICFIAGLCAGVWAVKYIYIYISICNFFSYCAFLVVDNVKCVLCSGQVTNKIGISTIISWRVKFLQVTHTHTHTWGAEILNGFVFVLKQADDENYDSWYLMLDEMGYTPGTIGVLRFFTW